MASRGFLAIFILRVLSALSAICADRDAHSAPAKEDVLYLGSRLPSVGATDRQTGVWALPAHLAQLPSTPARFFKPAPQQLVTLDNARVHHNQQIALIVGICSDPRDSHARARASQEPPSLLSVARPAWPSLAAHTPRALQTLR